MTHRETVAALHRTRLQQLDCNHEDLAKDVRDLAELAEWKRIEQLLAVTGGVYDPDADATVQDERTAHAARQRAG
ncbi:hypothetical protein [Streptomyces minutiscleroticus]|nr:hypothetical protein [Streptomyces minutiscleroticus]